jgi:hypothetical protein
MSAKYIGETYEITGKRESRESQLMNADISLVTLSLGRKDETGGTVVRYVPLGALYLTSALEKEEYDVELKDFQSTAHKELSADGSSYRISGFGGNAVDRLAGLLESSAEIIGISCMSDLLPLAVRGVEKLKERSPGKIIIMGGIGPSGAAAGILRHFPFIDIIVKGEGEKTIVDVMDHLLEGKSLERVPGICFRHGDTVYDNPPRQRIQDIDAIPFPAYRNIDFSHYTVPGILSSRGCPLECMFCDASPYWGNICRTRRMENVIEEIRLLRETYGCRYIEIVDDAFTLDRPRVLEFCQMLQEERLNIQWSCCGRIDRVDRALLEEMVGSGCTMISYGVESGAENVLRLLHKGFSRKQAMEVLAMSAGYVDTAANFIWGFPFETMNDFRDTLNMVAQIMETGVQPWLFSLSPLPFSRIYQEYKNDLQFSETFCSNYLGLLDQGGGLTELIKKHPGIFPGFYYCDPDFEQKYAIACQLGLIGSPFVNRPGRGRNA